MTEKKDLRFYPSRVVARFRMTGKNRRTICQCDEERGSSIFVFMGILEADHQQRRFTILSNLFLYGTAISETIRKEMEEEINQLWNEARGLVWLENYPYLLCFQSKVFLFPDLKPHDIFTNKNPRNNYFRIEEYAHGNISFVDGLGCNSGYFKLENLYTGSTTAAHEYGHTLGLPHPEDLDIRGKGLPGIMYPRGTLVDPEFQYDPLIKAGEKGGTLYPVHRRVLQHDINDLQIAAHILNKVKTVGSLSSVYHERHIEEARG